MILPQMKLSTNLNLKCKPRGLFNHIVLVGVLVSLALGQAGPLLANPVFTGGSQTVSGAGGVINGGGGGGYFVSAGTVTFHDATFLDFNTTGGSGSGGGAGMGGVIFVNSGASVILNNVNFFANEVSGGAATTAITGGNLNNLSPANLGAILSGTAGTAGANGDSDANLPILGSLNLNGGDGRDGYNGERGGNATNGLGGAGGNGGNGSDGATVHLDTVIAAFEIAKEGFETASDGAEAALYTTISATFTALAGAAAAGANAGGPTTAHLAAQFGTLAGTFGTLAGTATGSATQGVIDAAFALAIQSALEVTALDLGLTGNGGSGGSAGGGGDGSDFFGGGAGGKGGNGGDAASFRGAANGGSGGDGGDGGSGGFGAGGGRGGNSGTPGDDGPDATNAGDYGSGGSGGAAGFGGGVGANGDDHPDAPTQAGSGGSGLGGALFLRDGASATITGNATFAGNAAYGGEGLDHANLRGTSGIGVGADIFMMAGSTLTLDPGTDNVILFEGTVGASIADDSFASMDSVGGVSNVATGEGAGVTIASGLVIFNAQNVYTGQTRIAGGVLQAQDGHGIATHSNINIAGGVLQSHGEFVRFLGTQPHRLQWTGSGGFAAAGGDLEVRLNYGTPLTWNSGSFVPTGNALIFGSTSATDDVHFINDVNLAGDNRTILVRANADNDNYAYMDGVISNGSLTVGDAVHGGVLVLTGANTFADGTTVNNGTLTFEDSGALNSDGDLTVNADGTVDISLSGDQAIGNLAGAGDFFLGGNTLTINQDENTTFSGSLQDGGLGGGTSGGIEKNLGGVLTISGANTYTGTTDLNAGTITLTGSLESLAVNIDAGATFNNEAGGLAAASTLTNDGTLNQNSDDTVLALINTGTINNDSFTLTAETYALNDGSVIHTNLGGGDLTANGTVAINGTTAAETVTVETGTTTLGSAERLLDTATVQIDGGATLVLGGDEKFGVLNGAGDLENNGGLVTVDSGSFSGEISGTGGLDKVSAGTLQLTGANTYSGATNIDAGTMELSDAGSLLSDSITIDLDATLDNLNGGLDTAATVTNDGTFNIAGVDDTITELINTGTVNGTATLTAPNYRLNSGSTVNANLGTGTVFANGTVALNGTSNAETFLVETGTTTLGSEERLRDDTDLTVSGGATLELGGDEKIGTLDGAGLIDNQGGRLTADDGVFSGEITGSGGLTKVSAGTLTLSGANTYTGSTSVEAGILDLTGSIVGQTVGVSSGATLNDVNAGLADNTIATVDGLLNLSADETIQSLSGSGAVELNNNTLTLDQGDFSGVVSGTGGLTKVSSETLTLSGANTYTGATQIDAGILDLKGSLESPNVTVDAGSTLLSKAAGLSPTSTLNNDGTVDIGATDDTIAVYNSTGTLLGTGTLTATTYNLNDGSKVDANLGSGTLETTGIVDLNGTSLAETVNVLLGSTLNLNAPERLIDSSNVTVLGTLALTAGDETIGQLNGDGTVEGNGNDLIVLDGGSFSGTLSAATVSVTGGNLVFGAGSEVTLDAIVTAPGGGITLDNGSTVSADDLIIAGGSVVGVNDGATLNSNGGIIINDTGTLRVDTNGTVSSPVITVDLGGVLDLTAPFSLNYTLLNGNGVVDTHGECFVNPFGSTVSGTLTFTAGLCNEGTIAGGNSPGLITVVGDYIENGTIFSELETTTPITGHDQTRVGGTVTLGPTSSLVVQTFNGAMPVRGNEYQIISNSTGGSIRVNGTFATVAFDVDGEAGTGAAVANAAAVFDVNTGKVIATGLNGDKSTFGDLGATPNERAFAASLFGVSQAQVGQNQIDSLDPLVGTAALGILTSPDLRAELSFFIPEYYGGIAEYALNGEAALSTLVRSRVSSLSANHESGGYAGYTNFRLHSRDNVSVSRNDGYVGYDRRLGSHVKLGMLLGVNEGSISGDNGNGRGDADGFGGMIYGDGKMNQRWTLFGTIGGSSTDFRLSRRTQQGLVAANTSVDGFSATIGARFLAKESEQFSLMPHFVFGYENASVKAFTESGAIDALMHGGYDTDRVTSELGASAVWSRDLNGRPVLMELVAGVKGILSENGDSMTATMVNNGSVTYPINYANDEGAYFNIKANTSYEMIEDTSIYAGYEGIFGNETSVNRVNVGVGKIF